MRGLAHWKIWHAGGDSDCLLELIDKEGNRDYLHLTEGAAYAMGTQLLDKTRESYEARQAEAVR